MPDLSARAKNRELLLQVVAKLNVITDLSREQAEARENGEPGRAAELDQRFDLIYAQKERSVGAWQEHVREHGC